MDETDIVTGVVAANGGRIVGKTRLQKTVYLLQSCGVDLGFDFDYHHYGPYSEDLSIASDDAHILGMLDVEWKNNYGNDYAVFILKSTPYFSLPEPGPDALRILARYDATTLELAATADFLRKNGYPESAWEETASRKAGKATPQKIESSKRLLKELDDLPFNF